jgi:uncharacterized protein
MIKQIFVNLPVKDLNKTMAFFKSLGFSFDPTFTDENAACLILGENLYVMLLVEKFFKSFIKKNIADSSRDTEVINAVAVESRNEVDEIAQKAIKAGGKTYSEPQDHGWMYSRAFEDLDGHLWEVVYMDMTQLPEEMKKSA